MTLSEKTQQISRNVLSHTQLTPEEETSNQDLRTLTLDWGSVVKVTAFYILSMGQRN